MSSFRNKFNSACDNILNVNFHIGNAPHPVEYFYHNKNYTFDPEEFIRTRILPNNLKTNFIVLDENFLINEEKETKKNPSLNKLNDEMNIDKNGLHDNSLLALNLPMKLNDVYSHYKYVVEEINENKIKNDDRNNDFFIDIPKNEFDLLCNKLSKDDDNEYINMNIENNMIRTYYNKPINNYSVINNKHASIFKESMGLDHGEYNNLHSSDNESNIIRFKF